MTESAAGRAPLVIVLTGPSGVGKDALIDRLEEVGVPVTRPATMTTRARRNGEEEGVHHYFVGRREFLAHVAAGELLEHAEVYGNLYGVPKKSVRRALESGRHVVIRVDVQGAESLRDLLPGALFLSLEPETPEALRRHLEARGSETKDQIERRLAIALDEIERARAFCRPVRNIEGALDATVRAVVDLIAAELARPGRVPVSV